MAVYLITGRAQWMPLPPPLNILDLEDGVGEQINLTLTAQDEATLIQQGILKPIADTISHTILQ